MARRNNNNKDNFREESNNYQDKFADQEYKKGYNKGKRSGKKPFNPKYDYPNNIKGNKAEITPVMFKGRNDPTWHIPDDQLAKDVGQVSMYVADGAAIPVTGFDKITSSGYNINPIKVPGIMTFTLGFTIGDSHTVNDPINQGGEMLFTYLQRTTGRTPSYDPSAVMSYLLAMDSLYNYYQYLTRVYGTMTHFDKENRYFPETVLNAMNVNYSNLRKNQANFRSYINTLALKLASLPLPGNFGFLKFHDSVFKTIYKDSDTNKAQLYLFQPAGFYKWVEGVESAPITHLEWVPLRRYTNDAGRYTMDDLITLGDSLFDPLRYSNDIRMIGSDILNTLGDQLVTVNGIAETYEVFPVYDQEILAQIENMYVYGVDTNNVNITITPNVSINGGYLQSDYLFPMVYPELMPKTESVNTLDYITPTTMILNVHKPGPLSYQDVFNLTRFSGFGLSGALYVDNEVLFTGVRAQCFNLIFECFTLVQNVDGTSSNAMFDEFASLDAYETLGSLSRYIRKYSTLSRFDWHPQIRTVIVTSSSGGPQLDAQDVLLDLDNFAIVGVQQLENINKAAQIGEFYPRGLGGYSPVK